MPVYPSSRRIGTAQDGPERTAVPSTRHAHYERAFQGYLADHQVPYVSVAQLARSADAVGRIKNFDLLVHTPSGGHYIVDVKGKRFPSASGKREVFWENWVHLDDLDGLVAWEEHFGEGYTGLLVFVYWLQADVPSPDELTLYAYRHRQYLMMGITVTDFLDNCRRRSLRWQALYVPTETFVDLVRPVDKLVLNSADASTSKRLR